MLLIQVKHKQNIADFLVSNIFYLPQSAASYVLRMGNLSEENTKLKRENIKLKLEVDLAKGHIIENKRLRKLLNFEDQWNYPYPISLTQIIGYNPGTYMTTVVVNSGESDSIFYGMPVITTNGLVGKVSKVFSKHSMVQLLSDPNSRTSVISQRSRVLGTLFSRDNGEMQIQISSYADLVPGDTLVTSGLGGIYPKGIPVGVVSNLEKNNSEVLSYGEITLLQHIESLEEVFVIRKNMDWIVWSGE
ncbi:MAG: rod shape-determining protein MreC [Candidatus Fibromonas sp.]|jgi:rod shape-determining protein MreC|nr:rod shape-determining protein MreC [Candidatus Fibromonas sp.]